MLIIKRKNKNKNNSAFVDINKKKFYFCIKFNFKEAFEIEVVTNLRWTVYLLK